MGCHICTVEHLNVVHVNRPLLVLPLKSHHSLPDNNHALKHLNAAVDQLGNFTLEATHLSWNVGLLEDKS